MCGQLAVRLSGSLGPSGPSGLWCAASDLQHAGDARGVASTAKHAADIWVPYRPRRGQPSAFFAAGLLESKSTGSFVLLTLEGRREEACRMNSGSFTCGGGTLRVDDASTLTAYAQNDLFRLICV